MTSTGEHYIIGKIADLGNRYGVDPVSLDINLNYVYKENENGPGDGWYCLNGIAAFANNDEEAKVRKVWSLLGFDEFGTRRFETLNEVNKVVDQALSLAPRARTR